MVTNTRHFDITFKGISPQLMHWDNLDFQDQLEAWMLEPGNKKKSKPGDDRTPAWTWKGYTYNDGEHVAWPEDVLRACLQAGGSKVAVGKGRETFKRRIAAGLFFESPFTKLLVKGKPIKWSDIEAIDNEAPYADHVAAANKLGFRLFAKRVKVGQSKHVRVRPWFDDWSIAFRVLVTDNDITEKVLQTVVEQAGLFVGLSDWRPGAPSSPGPFGRFDATVK